MLYILAMCLGLVTGLLLKGKISNLADIKISKVWLVLLAFAIQTFARIMGARGSRLAIDNTFIIQLIVFFMLAAGFWFNRQYAGMLISGTGYLMNALVIMVNGGKMPVSADVIAKTKISHFADVIKSGADIKHVIMNESTKLGFLADKIRVPGFLGTMMQVVSIGDIIIILGIFILTVEFVRGRRAFDIIKKV